MDDGVAHRVCMLKVTESRVFHLCVGFLALC